MGWDGWEGQARYFEKSCVISVPSLGGGRFERLGQCPKFSRFILFWKLPLGKQLGKPSETRN